MRKERRYCLKFGDIVFIKSIKRKGIIEEIQYDGLEKKNEYIVSIEDSLHKAQYIAYEENLELIDGTLIEDMQEAKEENVLESIEKTSAEENKAEAEQENVLTEFEKEYNIKIDKVDNLYVTINYFKEEM